MDSNPTPPLNHEPDGPGADISAFGLVARRMTFPPSASATFRCSRDGQVAAEVDLSGKADGSGYLLIVKARRRVAFHLVPGAFITLVEDALRRLDTEGLLAMQPNVAPFRCPTCHENFCDECWNVFDEMRSRCPVGHERPLP